jgi:hypothetical protein
MGKFNDYSDSGTIQPTDLFAVSRAPYTAGTFYSATQAEILNYGWQQIALTTDVTLSAITASTLITGSTPSLSITLPSMLTSVWPIGRPFQFQNGASYPVAIKTSSGAALVTIKPTETYVLNIVSKSTADGVFAAAQIYFPISRQGVDIYGTLIPTLTNGCTITQYEDPTNFNNIRALTFAGGTDSSAYGSFAISQKWSNNNTGMTLIVMPTTAGSGTIRFEASTLVMQEGDVFAATGTPQAITISANGIGHSLQYINITNSIVPAIPTTPAVGNRFLNIRIKRKGTVDTYADPVFLVGAIYFSNLIAANDSGNLAP